MDQKRIDNFNKLLATLPLDHLREKEAKHQKKHDEDFEDFRDSLEKGDCFYCGYSLSHFSQKKPCFHWLLNPKGFKKKHFPLLFEDHGFRQLNTYLRWVANTDHIAKNINDLVDERSSSKFIEETISYKNLEWSFSCSESDRKGHAEAHKGKMPHYHFQMKVDVNVVINFNAFHIPFNDYDEFSFAVEAGKFDALRSYRRHDIGMQAVLDHLGADYSFADTLQYTADEENAALHTNIMIQADAGTTISGDELAELFEERNRTGKSMVGLAKKLKNVTVQSFVSAGEGVPEIAARSGGRGKGGK